MALANDCILFVVGSKLRCPRNYLHINLFVVIMVRIILVITVDKIMRNNASQLLEMNELYGNLNIKAVSKLTSSYSRLVTWLNLDRCDRLFHAESSV